MTTNQVVVTRFDGDIAWITLNNPPVNATSRALRQELLDAVGAVQDARVAILICEGKTFIAGGDMSEFDGPPLEPHLPDVVQAIEDSKTPIIAAMHGNVLGGGFEIAMGCAFRIAKPETRFGLPEVNVGLIPGAGGSQRAPRLVGLNAAIDMACSGKMLNAAEMLALGGVDAIAEDDLKSAAEDFANNLPERPVPISERQVTPLGADELEAIRTALQKKAKGQTSPLHNLDALQWSLLPFAKGQPKERELHLKLRQTFESKALRHAFFAERMVAKPAAIDDAEPIAIEKIAIVGGGLMGAGIAANALSSGLQVILIERDEESAAAAKQRVAGLIDGALKRGKITESKRDQQLASFDTTYDYGDAADVDIAIEAVFEDLEVKRQVFSSLSKVVRKDAILATNTSYIDPVEIFDGTPNLERCIGLHFFSPAHIMKLLEIVKTPDTSAQTIATGFALGRKMRKISVLSGICDGFIGNRILAVYRREAEYLLADGALPHQVDAAMRDAGMPLGPFELQDLTGLQIAWANRQGMADSRDPNERYETIADTLCEMDRLGQRSSMGWYSYADGSRTPQRDTLVDKLIEDYSATKGITRRTFTSEEIAKRLMAVQANEGARIIEEGIAERDADVDMVKIHGYGFPRWLGGPMFRANALGWENIAATMDEISKSSPNSWRLAKRVTDHL